MTPMAVLRKTTNKNVRFLNEPVSNTDIANMQPYIAITRNVLNTKSLPSP